MLPNAHKAFWDNIPKTPKPTKKDKFDWLFSCVYAEKNKPTQISHAPSRRSAKSHGCWINGVKVTSRAVSAQLLYK